MNIKTAERYKYLGINLNENLDFHESAKELTEAGGQALGVSFQNLKYTIYCLSYIYKTV